MGNPLKPVGAQSYDDYVRQGFQYVVVHSDAYQTLVQNDRYAARYPAFARFYRELFARGDLIQEFAPREGALRGPVVRVYAISSETGLAKRRSDDA